MKLKNPFDSPWEKNKWIYIFNKVIYCKSVTCTSSAPALKTIREDDCKSFNYLMCKFNKKTHGKILACDAYQRLVHTYDTERYEARILMLYPMYTVLNSPFVPEEFPAYVWMPLADDMHPLVIINGDTIYLKVLLFPLRKQRFLKHLSYQSQNSKEKAQSVARPSRKSTSQVKPLTSSLAKLKIKEEDDNTAELELIAKINKWAKTPDNDIKNINVLLASLHQVLWPNSNWEPVPTSFLLSDDKQALKQYYRQALLLCHPDKQNMADERRILHAQLITLTLQESWKQQSLLRP